MPNTSGNNKLIAKNTLFLYFRMMLTMGISLYTSRVVLNTLGVEDYGIYNIVGGVIMIFGFLNSSMSGATSRFLTFELGRQDYENLKKTFSAALIVHFIIAGIIFVLGETIGLWWLENKLVILPERMNAARWVYQLSIISTMISITQVPYNATIIAHERMGVFAVIEIINKSLLLGIIFLVAINPFDKLIFYAILLLAVTFTIAMTYRIYCIKNFPESHFKYEWNKEIIKPMISFSGWNLYVDTSYFAKNQGINIILNMFFGIILNAAYGIANQVQGIVSSFVNNFLISARPQIIKLYAEKQINQMQRLIINISKFSLILVFMVVFPLILENKYILHIWLGKVPEYAVIFCQLTLTYSFFQTMSGPITYAIFATGKIKFMSIITGTIYFLVLPVSYFLFKSGYSPSIPFITNIILLIMGIIINMIILKRLISQFSIPDFIQKSILPVFIVLAISLILPIWIHVSLSEGGKRFLLVCCSSVLVLCTASYFIALNNAMRKKLNIFLIGLPVSINNRLRMYLLNKK